MRFLRPLRRRTGDEHADNVSVYEPVDVPEADEFEDDDRAGVPDHDADAAPVQSATIDPYDHLAVTDDQALADQPRRIRRPRLVLPRPSLPRPRLGFEIRFSALLFSLALVGGGIFGTLLIQERLKHEVEIWWPAIIIGVAVIWMLLALVRQRATSFLGAAALAGVGLSALLSTQDIAALRDTLLGMVLVTTGVGIIIRGFLLRQRTPL